MKTLEFNHDSDLEAANIRPVPKIFEREGIFHHELEWKDGLDTQPWEIPAEVQLAQDDVSLPIELSFYSNLASVCYRTRNVQELE